MSREKSTSAPPAEATPGPKNRALAARLARLLEERGTSPRAISKKAGLSADAVRNISSGRAASPRVTTLQRLADALDVPLSALTIGFSGEEVADMPGVPPLPTSPPPSFPPRLREGQVELMEYDLRRPVAGADGDIKAGRPFSAAWSVPLDVLEGAAPADLAVVRAPSDTLAPEISPGDRLLVDVTVLHPSPPGIFVTWDGIGHSLARCAVVGGREHRRVRITTARGSEEQPIDDIEIVGRVIAKLWSRV
jgi:transcriptional regulator with XRE-family HTH domain